jgi:hypothetical protein
MYVSMTIRGIMFSLALCAQHTFNLRFSQPLFHLKHMRRTLHSLGRLSIDDGTLTTTPPFASISEHAEL